MYTVCLIHIPRWIWVIQTTRTSYLLPLVSGIKHTRHHKTVRRTQLSPQASCGEKKALEIDVKALESPRNGKLLHYLHT